METNIIQDKKTELIIQFKRLPFWAKLLSILVFLVALPMFIIYQIGVALIIRLPLFIGSILKNIIFKLKDLFNGK